MEKQKLIRFIGKYSLGSLIESVKWESDNSSLTTSFISDDKSVLGSVKMSNFNQPANTFGVYDTTKLIKMLSVLGNTVDYTLTEAAGESVSLKFKDESTSVNYMLANLSVIPSVPDLKSLPEFDVKIKIDQSFIAKYIRAKAALSDEATFTFKSDGKKSQIILGYASINTNRITIDVDANVSGVIDPISFDANYLKEILAANKEAKDAVLEISTKGLSHIHFEVDEYISDYYLVQKEA